MIDEFQDGIIAHSFYRPNIMLQYGTPWCTALFQFFLNEQIHEICGQASGSELMEVIHGKANTVHIVISVTAVVVLE